MTKTLEQRIVDAREKLIQIDTALGGNGSRLDTEVVDWFSTVAQYRSNCDCCLELIQARNAGSVFLDNLVDNADANDCVQWGGTQVKFQHVRLMGVQAYISTTWALADRITGMAGFALCTPEAGSNRKDPPQLVSNFVQKSGRNKQTAAVMSKSIRQLFGWPIVVSYSLRNHFVHDGGAGFFAGPSAAAAFQISGVGWKLIEDSGSDNGVSSNLHRAGASWTPSLKQDLRKVLAFCEREIDDALGIILGTAFTTVGAHLGLLLGED